jgi:uncharacterized protein YqeY
MSIFDTIAAVSTPRGKGGIAVLRISGEGTRALVQKVFSPRGKTELFTPRHAILGDILGADSTPIDEGLCTFFAAPNSFTGEDVAELSCHGGTLLTEQVLSAVLAAGARTAEAGEFTRRAVMNGKMKLSSAEALGALLEAKTAPGANDTVSDETAIKIIQKLVKQGKESAELYSSQNRPELAAEELAQVAVMERYLPAQMSEEEVAAVIKEIIANVGAGGPQDMGKVMGVATKQLAGKAEGRMISAIVKQQLNN